MAAPRLSPLPPGRAYLPVGNGGGEGGGVLVTGIYLGFGVWDLVLFLFLSFVGKSFVDQHHRDIILDGIEQMAGFTDQTISCLIQEDIPFTFWTS